VDVPAHRARLLVSNCFGQFSMLDGREGSTVLCAAACFVSCAIAHQRSVTAYKVPLPLAEKANKPSSSWGFDDSVPGSHRACLPSKPRLNPTGGPFQGLDWPNCTGGRSEHRTTIRGVLCAVCHLLFRMKARESLRGCSVACVRAARCTSPSVGNHVELRAVPRTVPAEASPTDRQLTSRSLRRG
jgi:hypothetical protein